MERIHLFEFEDFAWFPEGLRRCMMRLILVMHGLVGSGEKVAGLVAKVLRESNSSSILDLCSGSGGPMPEVLTILRDKYDMRNINLTLTDLYPDSEAAKMFNRQNENNISYLTNPVDAADTKVGIAGPRTMIGSFHHMSPQEARNILASVQEIREPICIFEISDNSFPIWLWWIAVPVNFVMTFFITPMARPMTWQQLFFTYVIPVIPLCFAWDGAVSNARTYTLDDLDELLAGFQSEDDDYRWEKGTFEGKTTQLYLLGIPE